MSWEDVANRAPKQPFAEGPDELLAEKLAQEDDLPEHRDSALHMIVKDGEMLDPKSPGVKRWLKFHDDPKNDACRDALRAASDTHPEWTAAEVVHQVRRKNAPRDKDSLGFKLSQNLMPYIARWLSFDDPKRRRRFKFSLMGKTRGKKVVTGKHCSTCTCSGPPALAHDSEEQKAA